ncbi:MAG: hypothetical protein JSU96_02340 [Acidobacteriota bacterium]|nr:MAG: hypothetical protein JSU96_02340 [Acidobacteriota bacterium]
MSEKGSILFIILILVLVMAALLGVAALQVVSQWRVASSVEKQLYAVSLSASGIEYGRSLLQSLEPDELLKGRDGVLCASGESRDPVPAAIARFEDLRGWSPSCDDGYPFDPESGGTLYRYEASESASFWVRFSNDPAEEYGTDTNGIIVLRSLGVAGASLSSPELPRFKNHVALTEAAFRIEKQFEVSAALTLFASELQLDLDGSQFQVNGGEVPAVGVIGLAGANLVEEFEQAVGAAQLERFGSGETIPVVADLSRRYESNETLSVLLQPGFWQHVEQHLADFARPIPADTPSGSGLYLFTDGDTLVQTLSGVVIGQGDLRLTEDSRIRGLLIHLGNGSLHLEADSVVEGGVWLSNVDASKVSLTSRPVQLRIADQSSIRYDREQVRSALSQLPPTQLYWRMIFPETRR